MVRPYWYVSVCIGRRLGRGRGVKRKSRGDGGRAVRRAAADPRAFARCSVRLERAIAGSCEARQPWPARVAAAIRAALAFADAEPVAAGVVAVPAAFRRYAEPEAFTAMVDRLAARLRDGAPPTRHPERTARNVVLRVARQTLLQLELRPKSAPSDLAPELIVFALTPYVGLAEAQRWADPAAAGH